MKKVILSILLAGLSLASAPMLHAQTTHQHAFLWDGIHGMKDLGTLGGKNSFATGINDSGVVVGYSDMIDRTTHAFTWTKATGMVDIGIYFTGRPSTQAAAINAQGAVAGTGVGLSPNIPALFTPPNTWLLLDQVSNYYLNFAFGINDSNQLTGQIYQGNGVFGYFWDPAQNVFTLLPVFPDGTYTVGNAINNLGHIAGTATLPGAFHGLFWTAGGGSRDIGGLNGSAYTAAGAINDRDEVVGYNVPELAGFYWSQPTGLLPLQSLGGSMSAAFGINVSGMIAGYSSTADGTVHATRWTDHTSAPQDLGSLKVGGNSYARGINNKGQVVGYADSNAR
jgi:probable HAF family extracellular repeat protein